MGRSSTLWRGWIPYLARFYKVVRLDLRGCGKSGAEGVTLGKLTVEQFLSDITGVLDEVGAKSAHYCGDSFGGILGMTLAATQASRIRTLSLLSSPVYLDDHNIKGVSLGYPTWHEALRDLGSKGWAERMHQGVLMDDKANPRMAAWFAADMGETRLDTLLAFSHLAMSVKNVAELLPRIEAPVLGLYPTHGTLTSNTQENVLRSGIRNLRLVQMPFPYHMAQHITPGASASHVLHFAAQFDGTVCRE